MPAHTNPAGNIFGGWIMASMDAAAGMTTTRLAEAQTVTVTVSNMVFMQPVKVGDTVFLYQRKADRTHLDHVGCGSLGAPARMRSAHQGAQAEFTFVVREDGRPRQVAADPAVGTD